MPMRKLFANEEALQYCLWFPRYWTWTFSLWSGKDFRNQLNIIVILNLCNKKLVLGALMFSLIGFSIFFSIFHYILNYWFFGHNKFKAYYIFFLLSLFVFVFFLFFYYFFVFGFVYYILSSLFTTYICINAVNWLYFFPAWAPISGFFFWTIFKNQLVLRPNVFKFLFLFEHYIPLCSIRNSCNFMVNIYFYFSVSAQPSAHSCEL